MAFRLLGGCNRLAVSLDGFRAPFRETPVMKTRRLDSFAGISERTGFKEVF